MVPSRLLTSDAIEGKYELTIRATNNAGTTNSNYTFSFYADYTGSNYAYPAGNLYINQGGSLSPTITGKHYIHSPITMQLINQLMD